MGQGKSKEDQLSEDLQRQLQVEQKEARELLKLLLLGPGESGKSTLFKQAVNLYGRGFNEDERKDFGVVIGGNVLGGMTTLAKQSNIVEGCQVADTAIPSRDFFLKLNMRDDAAGELTLEAAEHVTKLWADPGIKKAWSARASFQIPDSCSFFFDEIQRLTAPSFIPTDEDILLCRARTTGIVETCILLGGQQFVIVDVGGQRSERKKWINCFSDVLCVVFVASLSGYDMTCSEDGKTNRMAEALSLFSDTCNQNWFERASLVLLLNKRDLFETKLTQFPLSDTFPEFEGGDDYDAAVQFVLDKFLEVNKSGAPVYPHVTCATDTENAKFLFAAVKDTVISNSLRGAGLVV